MTNQYSTHNGGNWTDERTTKLIELWQDQGLSASECAKRLGGFAHCDDGGRSAVIGKVHRLGLATRDERLTRSRKPIPKRPSRQRPRFFSNPAFREMAEKHQQTAEAYVELVIPESERKTIVTLEDGDCRWGIGDPQAADFHFCGKEKVPGLPYCQFHCFRAYQPTPVRRHTVSVFPGVPATSIMIVPEEVDA